MRVWRRVRRILAARRFERELAEEVRFHREMAGGPAFGSVALAMEESRAVWRFAWLDSLAQDVRYALRGFRKSPGFAATVVLTLALGLGTLATSFSVFNALVLRPFAVRDPYSLYSFLGWGEKKGSFQTRPFSWRGFNDLRRWDGPFSDVLGYMQSTAIVDGKLLWTQSVTGNYFNMLGARICLGRPITENDDGPGEGVAVASYAEWKNRLGGDPAALGRKVRLDGSQAELVGVACPEFNGLEERRIDYWYSLAVDMDLFSGRDPERLSVVGRLKPGVTKEGAEAALVAYGRGVYTTWRYGRNPPASATLRPAATVYPLNRDSVARFLPAFAAFGLVLLIACANVSNLMLARGLARQREIGIRISLGAGRARVIRQLLTEGLLLAVPAAVAAFLVAHASIRAATWLQTDVLHVGSLWTMQLANDAPDWRVLVFLLAMAGLATLAFGLAPALQTVRSRLVEANRGEFAADRRPARLRSALVVAQVTVCAVLLIAAGVALRGERRLASEDLGFGLDVRGVFSVMPAVSNGRRASRIGPDITRLVWGRLAALPQTVSVAASAHPPGAGYRPRNWDGVALPYNRVSAEYFGVFGVPIRGRNFRNEEADSEAPVVIVSEAAARRLWPRGDALGKTLRGEDVLPGPGNVRMQPALVVGVVPDSGFLFDSEAPDGRKIGAAYYPTRLQGRDYFGYLLARTRGDPAAARRAIEAAAPLSNRSVRPLQELLDAYLYPYRALVAITAFLGALALALTVSGVFAVSSYAVAQRRREFGIRMALGASEERVTRLALGHSLLLAAAGAALGGAAALAVARVAGHAVRGIDVFDAGGYAGGALVVMAAALAAAWIPARRAARVDPAKTLRCD